MHVEHWGPSVATAPRALLVHGLTSSGETMWELGEGLAAAGWSVTAPDLPGHGSSPDARSYRHADLADGLAELGTGFDLYVGHSLGGSIAVPLLAARPGTARRAVLIDPVVAIDVDLAGAEFRVDPGQLDAAAVAAANPRWHPRTVQARVRSSAAVRPAAVAAIRSSNRPWDLFDLAATVTVPVHVLGAATGAAFTAADGRRLAAANPRWTWETVPDTTHSVHRDRPDVVLAELLRRPVYQAGSAAPRTGMGAPRGTEDRR